MISEKARTVGMTPRISSSVKDPGSHRLCRLRLTSVTPHPYNNDSTITAIPWPPPIQAAPTPYAGARRPQRALPPRVLVARDLLYSARVGGAQVPEYAAERTERGTFRGQK